MQATLKHSISFTGVGLHSGQPAGVTVHPAPTDHGIVFRRSDVTGADPMVPARWDLVEQTPLCTRLVNAAGVSVSTVEHLMAALAGCGIHNASVEVDGPEIPILDGSALPFVRAIVKAGLACTEAPLRAIRILRPIQVETASARAELRPADTLHIDFEIDFAEAAIGRQTKSLCLANGAFVRDLSDSRTFCRFADVQAMRAQGLAQGGTLLNAVVFDGDRVLSPGGMRHADEPVRHKMLDALGDLALAGAPILGRYVGHKAGHAVTNSLLRALFAQPDNWRWVTLTPAQQARLPGTGVSPADLDAVA